MENTGSSAVYVLGPSPDARAQDLVDGIISLSAGPRGNPGAYAVVLEKLRGREIRRRRYVLTVRDGRFWEASEQLLGGLEGRPPDRM